MASARGVEEARKDSLTPIARRTSRNLHYLFDRLTGSLLRLEALTLIPNREVRKLRHAHVLSAELGEEDLPSYVDRIDRLSCLEGFVRSDEKIVGCDPHRSVVQPDWYLQFTSVGGEVEGLPRAASNELKKHVRALSSASPAVIQSPGPRSPDTTAAQTNLPVRRADLAFDDLILGGPAHLQLLESILQNARRRVVIHSTFLLPERLGKLGQILADAAERDVSVDLLWDYSGSEKDATALRESRKILDHPRFHGLVRLSCFPTRSHSKQILADDGKGRFFAVVGSCNWLSSPFKSFEVSVRLRNAASVFDCVRFLERMLPLDGQVGELREELLAIALDLDRHDAASESGSSSTQMLDQGAHELIVRLARDDAEQRIFVASNKAGNTIETQVLAPFDGAARLRPLNIDVYYQSERDDSALTSDVLTELKARYENRIKITAVDRAHAKLLCWDSDHAVISSLNWLSKDASSSNPRGECGIYIRSPGIAQRLIDAYLGATSTRKDRSKHWRTR